MKRLDQLVARETSKQNRNWVDRMVASARGLPPPPKYEIHWEAIDTELGLKDGMPPDLWQILHAPSRRRRK
jgi:hypothetical protein